MIIVIVVYSVMNSENFCFNVSDVGFFCRNIDFFVFGG